MIRYTVNELTGDAYRFVVDERHGDRSIYYTNSRLAAWLVAIWKSGVAR